MATKALGGGKDYTGQFSGQTAVTGPGFCGFAESVTTGTLIMHVEDISASSVKGVAGVDEDGTSTYLCVALASQPPGPVRIHAGGIPLTGTSDNLGFTFRRNTTFSANGQTGIDVWTLSFTGAFNGSEVVGVLTNTRANESASGQVVGSGTTAFPITLR